MEEQHDKVVDYLRTIESQSGIEIIYAAEVGSRVWGWSSSKSDYDIRFVYCPINNNNKTNLPRKQQQLAMAGFSQDRVYDWQGWDIRRAIELLESLNPTLVECIHSPIVYVNHRRVVDFAAASRVLVEKQNRILPLVRQYKAIARNNFRKHIEKNTKVCFLIYKY